MEENLADFEKMRSGGYEAGGAVLRMRMDLTSPNPNMWDHMAYRVKKEPHPHTGTEWCIYPTYDYTHCLVDSFEDITHSTCNTNTKTLAPLSAASQTPNANPPCQSLSRKLPPFDLGTPATLLHPLCN